MFNKPILDGWKPIYIWGGTYWEMYDDGDFVVCCTESTRDKILQKTGLPLKLIDFDINEGLTDF